MRGQTDIWYQPKQIRELRRELEQQATRLLRRADRRRHNKSRDRAASSAPPIDTPPRCLTFDDLPRLRKEGKVP